MQPMRAPLSMIHSPKQITAGTSDTNSIIAITGAAYSQPSDG